MSEVIHWSGQYKHSELYLVKKKVSCAMFISVTHLNLFI